MPDRPPTDAQERYLREVMGERAVAIGKLLEGRKISLIDADRQLDDARRLLFACHFQVGVFEDLADAVGCGEAGRAIAVQLEGLNLMMALAVIEKARWVGWQTAYPGAAPVHSPEVH